ncbi:hypothetical protein ACLOJK_020608 [Asimina triloba]
MKRYERQRTMALAEGVARGCLVAFSYRNLQSLTKNFSEKLGGGGFGSVFRGTLPDLTMVAVMRLEGVSQGEKQFRAEVSTIGTIQHVNLICLRRFCSDDDKKLLVYDYMPNGSLNSHLFGTQKNCLDWSRRYQIAIETVRGLAYLHEKCRDCIIHCDIKPENILLDTSNPKSAETYVVSRAMWRLLDDRLEGNSNMEEDHENESPSMGQIVQILEGVLEVNVPPMPRLLQIPA